MKIIVAVALSIGLLMAICSSTMECQLLSQLKSVSIDSPLHSLFGNPTLLTLPRDMKVYIITQLTTSHGSLPTELKEHLAAAAKNIRAMAAVNKEFYGIINDAQIMTHLMECLASNYQQHLLDVASTLGTLACAQSLAHLLKEDPGWYAAHDPAICVQEVMRVNTNRSLRFLFKAIKYKIITFHKEEHLNKRFLNEILFSKVVLYPDLIAVLLECPTIDIHYKSEFKENRTPVAYAKFQLENPFLIWDNEAQQKAALKQTIKLLEEKGATE